jgi:succinyl-CoA synthetase alpha subunit
MLNAVLEEERYNMRLCTWRFVLAAVVWCVFLPGCKPAEKETAALPTEKVKQAVIVFEGVAPEDEMVLKDLLRVDGVLVQGTQYICSINGQICNVGENLKLSAKTRSYNLKLLAISGDRVLLSAVESQ